MRNAFLGALASLCVVCWPSAAVAQASGRFWANAIANWLASDTLTYQLDIESKTNPSYVKVMPHVEYDIASWADVLAEIDLQRTAGSDATATPRFGAQFFILSRLLRRNTHSGPEREKTPLRRLAVSSLLRAENADSSWRLRDRFDAAYPLNRHKTSDDGAVYVTSDVELFMPFERATGAALVSQMRIRSGIGYRENFKWRFEALYIWDGTRHADTAPLTTQSHAIDIRVRREF